MQKRERRLTALLLGCLALVSAAVTAWVCLKEQPGNVAAFETRFLDVSEMGFEAGEGLALEALPDAETDTDQEIGIPVDHAHGGDGRIAEGLCHVVQQSHGHGGQPLPDKGRQTNTAN